MEVQFGSIRMKISVDRIDRVDREGEPASSWKGQPLLSRGPDVSNELDLRGSRAEDALAEFEIYVDQAYRAGLPFVRIIHGKGTGVLRDVIRDALRSHPLVRTFEAAPQNEGGDGVTIAVLAG